MPAELIHYLRRGHPGEPLLLIHGFSGSSGDWNDLIATWQGEYDVIAVDLRGHGKSGTLQGQFRHRDAAADVVALLDSLGITSCKAAGVSAGGNVLLQMAIERPGLISAMAVASATPYFPDQARALMRTYGSSIPESQREYWRATHPGGEAQIQALIESARGFADDYEDMSLTPPNLARIAARTLVIFGDRDPLYPVELSIELFRAIPSSSLWVVPQGGHGPVFGEHRTEFLRVTSAFLKG